MGKAEEVLGRILAGERRSSYVLATKVYGRVGDKPTDAGLSRKHILESCHASLRRLQTDYIDLYQAHRYDEDTPLVETMRAFDDLVRQGKVHYVGISEWSAAQIADALRIADELGLDRIVSSQPQYSLLWRVPEAEVMPLCRREGIGQVVWSPLAMGVLTGKYLPGQPRPEGTRAAYGSGVSADYLRDEVLTAVHEVRRLAEEAGLTTAQLALAWVLRNDNVSAAIVGATKPEQVVDNAGASGVTLGFDLVHAVESALADVAVWGHAT